MCVCGGRAGERAWTLEQRGGVQRGEPLRAEVLGAGVSGQCPASILKCSQLGPRRRWHEAQCPADPASARSSVPAVASVQRRDPGPLVRVSPSAFCRLRGVYAGSSPWGAG